MTTQAQGKAVSTRELLATRIGKQALKVDPTDGQYVRWILRESKAARVRIKEDGGRITASLIWFNANKQKLPTEQRDINKLTIHELEALVDVGRNVHVDDDAVDIEGTELLFNSVDLKVYQVKTVEGAVKVARGTRWCTSDKGVAARYLKRGLLYIRHAQHGKFQMTFGGYCADGKDRTVDIGRLAKDVIGIRPVLGDKLYELAKEHSTEVRYVRFALLCGCQTTDQVLVNLVLTFRDKQYLGLVSPKEVAPTSMNGHAVFQYVANNRTARSEDLLGDVTDVELDTIAIQCVNMSMKKNHRIVDKVIATSGVYKERLAKQIQRWFLSTIVCELHAANPLLCDPWVGMFSDRLPTEVGNVLCNAGIDVERFFELWNAGHWNDQDRAKFRQTIQNLDYDDLSKADVVVVATIAAKMIKGRTFFLDVQSNEVPQIIRLLSVIYWMHPILNVIREVLVEFDRRKDEFSVEFFTWACQTVLMYLDVKDGAVQCLYVYDGLVTCGRVERYEIPATDRDMVTLRSGLGWDRQRVFEKNVVNQVLQRRVYETGNIPSWATESDLERLKAKLRHMFSNKTVEQLEYLILYKIVDPVGFDEWTVSENMPSLIEDRVMLDVIVSDVQDVNVLWRRITDMELSEQHVSNYFFKHVASGLVIKHYKDLITGNFEGVFDLLYQVEGCDVSRQYVSLQMTGYKLAGEHLSKLLVHLVNKYPTRGNVTAWIVRAMT